MIVPKFRRVLFQAGADLLQESRAQGDRHRGEHERLRLPELLRVLKHLL